VVGWANNKEGIKLRNKFDTFPTDLPNVNEILEVGVGVDFFDPNGKSGPTCGVQLTYFPFVNQTQVAAFPDPIEIIVQQQTFNFSANANLPDHAFSLSAPGNPNNYPFDWYNATLFINAGSIQTDQGLPLVVFTQGAVQGFIYTTQFQSFAEDGSAVSISFVVQRSTTTRVFAIIIFLLMWLLSLSIFIAAMSVWFRGKNAELPMVSISTALLFALPNIRNSQPGVPSPVGTTEDMVGFFWNILLVAASAVFLLIKWVLQNKRPRPDRMDVEK